MKKLMYLAMAAVLLMACDPNGRVDVPGNDKKALNQSAAKALTMIGGSATQVDKDLLNLGFTKTILMEGAPVRFNQPAMAQTTPEPPLEGRVYYLLNVPSRWLVMSSDDEMHALINELVESKRVGIIIQVEYYDGKLNSASCQVMVNADVKGVNNLFAGASRSLYGGMPKDAKINRYEAYVQNEQSEEKEASFNKREDFDAALASLEIGYARENCRFEADGKGAFYTISWSVLDSETRKEYENKGVLPFCAGSFSIFDEANIVID